MPSELIVRIQSVLFEATHRDFHRFVRGVTQAAASLFGLDPECKVDLCLGDCSPSALVSDQEIDELRSIFLQQGFRTFSYEHFGENLGHGGAQNRLLVGRENASLVLILNPDTCLGPGALTALLETMEDVTVGIAEARQLPLEHQKAYDLGTGDTSWASGACSLVRAAVFDQVGTFDDATFFLYCDDVDFSWRTRLGGWRVVHCPAATVFHDKRLSADAVYVPSETEKLYSSLAAVLLAAKYSRTDIAEERLYDLDNSPEPVHARAAAEYRRREASGLLAEPIDPQRLVAQFQTYAYADLRFDYTIAS